MKPHQNRGQDLDDFPDLRRRYDTLMARPAVIAGLAVGEEKRSNVSADEEPRKVLVGQRARA